MKFMINKTKTKVRQCQFWRKCHVSKMQTIEEESEGEYTEEEEPIEGLKLRKSLSTVQPRDRIRNVGDGWMEHATSSGRLYYSNSVTAEKSWKPPRKLLRETHESSQSKHNNLSNDPGLCRGWNSAELSTPKFQEVNHTNVGKILRTGILKTTLVEVNGEKVKKKWVTSFVVLTEFFILLTTVVGSVKKLFKIKKAKTSNPTKHSLLNAEVVSYTGASKHGDIYRLKTTSNDILFKSKKKTAAESWFHALALVINNLKDKKFDNTEQFDLRQRERTNSFDFGVAARTTEAPLATKSVSLSSFSLDEIDAPRKCLSDFFGYKYATPPGWITIFDSETQQFCYLNCITKNKWFRAMTDDGHTYFYEEGSNRRAWLLPSVYLDVNSQVLDSIRNSIGSHESLKSNS